MQPPQRLVRRAGHRALKYVLQYVLPANRLRSAVATGLIDENRSAHEARSGENATCAPAEFAEVAHLVSCPGSVLRGPSLCLATGEPGVASRSVVRSTSVPIAELPAPTIRFLPDVSVLLDLRCQLTPSLIMISGEAKPLLHLRTRSLGVRNAVRFASVLSAHGRLRAHRPPCCALCQHGGR